MTGGGPTPVAASVSVANFHHGLAWITVAAAAVACVPAGLRWLRVAQREHYLAGSAVRFAARWWTITAVNRAMAGMAVAAGVISVWWPPVGVVTAAAVVAGPLGLSWKGRTAPLAWTRRLRTLAGIWAVLEIVVVVLGVVTGLASVLAVVAALAVPLLVDAACVVTAPVERRLSEHFIVDAGRRLARVAPIVVGITGSYGKTSTKNHLAHLIEPTLSVVATPASFNNRAGLARAVNEHLTDGTRVFIAEMGTYGPGEIADMCGWCPPTVAVITAIGPVHLERFGTEERIVEAKSEIAVPARDVVIQVDDPRLAALADRLEAGGKHVVRCSASDPAADVSVIRDADPGRTTVTVTVDRETVATGIELPTGVQPSNLACAIGAARSVGVETAAIVAALADLPPVGHRLQAVGSPSGFTILDDTYNSNPTGARAALTALRDRTGSGSSNGSGAPGRGTATVVTPGMVELGSRQRAENFSFGAEIAGVADNLVVVGRTNRQALMAGAASNPAAEVAVTWVADRPQAVAWVRDHLGPGDTVLYENDLPDHYP
ncbi:MAG TPA: UDP-N-acetylmuramoyl-tripeptide--D-alanyl-D-alanine ligase [Acidimicrobiales bacterium]|nr:UDP-N-acetylmuramoyl-tripeptide--D-alanyl-D-alanine ligase [Acidimicrobiales bacterium]